MSSKLCYSETCETTKLQLPRQEILDYTKQKSKKNRHKAYQNVTVNKLHNTNDYSDTRNCSQ